MTLAMLPNQSQLAQTGSFMPVVPGQPLGPNGQPQHIIGQIRSQVAPLGVVSMAAPPTTTSEKTGIPSTSGLWNISLTFDLYRPIHLEREWHIRVMQFSLVQSQFCFSNPLCRLF